MYWSCDASTLVAKEFAETRDASRAQGDKEALEGIESSETKETHCTKLSSESLVLNGGEFLLKVLSFIKNNIKGKAITHN